MSHPNPLDEIQARADAATPGPWEAHLGAGWFVQDGGCDEIALIMDRPGIDEDPQTEANATFIINARQDLPALVAALRAEEALHSPVPSGPGEFVQLCRTCSDVEAVTLPCPTITAIREVLG